MGNAVPDELKDLRKTVCYAGYSSEHGLIRIYPVPPSVKMKRWQRVEVQLERNPQDVRKESCQIRGSKADWSRLGQKITRCEQLKRKEWVELLYSLHEQFGVDCVEQLNKNRLSLGLVKPRNFKPYFEKRKNFDASKQATLFGGEPFWTIHNYGFQPRLKYQCQNCELARGYHDQQIIEWGVYEWMRKNPTNIEGVWKNLHVGEEDFETSLLVGNQARQLTSFIVISIFRHKK